MHVKMLECNYLATQLKPTVCTKYVLHTRNAILCDCYTGTPAPAAAGVGGNLLSSLEEEASQSILEGELDVDIRFVSGNS